MTIITISIDKKLKIYYNSKNYQKFVISRKLDIIFVNLFYLWQYR